MGLYIFWPAAIVIPQMILSKLMKAFKVPQRKRKSDYNKCLLK